MRKLSLAALMSIMVAATAADAAPIALVVLDSLGNSSGVITDGGAADGDPADGVVSFNGAVGDWAVNTTSGTLSAGSMRLHSVNASALTNSTLFVLFTSLDNEEISDYEMTFAAAVQNGTAIYGAFGDPGNVGFGQSVGIGAIGPFVSDAALGLFSGEFLGAGPLSGPYSLTQLLIVSGDGDGVTLFTGDARLTAVPEPASVLLLGTGLVAAGLRAASRRGVTRRRERSSGAAGERQHP